jgi:hypothetical protein
MIDYAFPQYWNPDMPRREALYYEPDAPGGKDTPWQKVTFPPKMKLRSALSELNA